MKYDLEERPLIEFSGLVTFFIIFFSLAFGVSFLFLPWYVVLVLFTGFAITIGIVFNPFIGVLLFLVTTYVHVMAFAPVELIKSQPAVMAGGIVLLAWLFHLIIYKDFKLPRSPQFLCVIGLTLMGFFSVIFHLNEYENFFLVFHFIKMLILYFLVTNLIKTEKQLYVSLTVILILTFGTALSGVMQYLQSEATIEVDRVAGFEGNPNALAINLVFIIPFIVGLIQYFSSLKLKALLLCVFLIVLSGIVFTFSRAGFLALAVVFPISLWRFSKRRNRIWLIIVFIVFLGLLIPFLPEQYWERIQSITDFSDVSIIGRLDSYRIGWQMIKDNPFLGIGPGRWAYKYVAYAAKLIGITTYNWCPFNVFIETGAENGLFALGFYVFIIFFSFKELNKAKIIFEKKGKLLLSKASQAFSITLIGFLVNTIFEAGLGLKVFWIIAGLSVVLKEVALNLELNTSINTFKTNG